MHDKVNKRNNRKNGVHTWADSFPSHYFLERFIDK